jgi:uncharacterized protein
MKIRLDEIGDEPATWDETLEIPADSLERPELAELGPVSWRGQVSRLAEDFLLRAHLSYPQTANCSRCLGPADEPIEETVELLIRMEEEPDDIDDDDAEREIEEDEMGILHVAGHVLDLQPLLREMLQLNVPMYPLCKPDCRGLCPQCGADRNHEPCDCDTTVVDPRWGALAALKGKVPDA